MSIIIAVGIISASSIVRVGGLKFDMTLDKNLFNLGEPVNVTFTVTNIGSETLGYLHSYPEFDFIVYDSLANSLYRWTDFRAVILIVRWQDLGPGDSFSATLVWPQTCNRTIENNDGILVPPGHYFIVGLYIRQGIKTTPSSVIIL